MVTSADDTSTAVAAGLAGSPEGWGWVLGCGIVLVIAGICAFAAPGVTTIVLTTLVGWLLVIAGVAGIVMGLRTRARHRRQIDLLYGVVSLLVGLVVLWNPLAGALSFTLAMAFWLAFRGAVELGGASRSTGSGRTLLIVAGVVNLLLALLLIVNFPFPAVQVIGVFVGVSFLIGGITTILAAVQLRRLANT